MYRKLCPFILAITDFKSNSTVQSIYTSIGRQKRPLGLYFGHFEHFFCSKDKASPMRLSHTLRHIDIEIEANKAYKFFMKRIQQKTTVTSD
jgi:hypothetical protein